MKFALIKNNLVVETFTRRPKALGSKVFKVGIDDAGLSAHNVLPVEYEQPEIDTAYQTIASYGTPYVQDGKVKRDAVVESLSIADLREKLKAQAATARFDEEVGGITHSGHGIHTDRESQGKLVGMYSLAANGALTELTYKTKDGFIELNTAPDIIALCGAVSLHVQGCYAREAVVVAALDAASTTAELLSVPAYSTA